MPSLCTHNNNTPQFNIYLLSWTIFVRVFIVYTEHTSPPFASRILYITVYNSILRYQIPLEVFLGFFFLLCAVLTCVFFLFIVLHMERFLWFLISFMRFIKIHIFLASIIIMGVTFVRNAIFRFFFWLFFWH